MGPEAFKSGEGLFIVKTTSFSSGFGSNISWNTGHLTQVDNEIVSIGQHFVTLIDIK